MPHHDDFLLRLRCGSQKAMFWHYAFSCSEIAGVFHTMHSEATIIRSSESRQHQINQNFQYGLVKSVVLPDSPEAAENQVNLLLKVQMHFSLILLMSCLIKEILRIERNKYEIQSLSYTIMIVYSPMNRLLELEANIQPSIEKTDESGFIGYLA